MLKMLGTFKDFSDNSLKLVFSNEHNGIIEMSLLSNKEGIDNLCVPSFHFCNLGCKMCHLTNNKLNKKMIPINIDDFLGALIRTVTVNRKRRTKNKKLLVSFMGVGEPLLNLKLIQEIYLNEYILKKRLKYEIPLKVHFSLHSPFDNLRKDLIPSGNTTVEKALKYLKEYRIMFRNNKNIVNKYIKLHKTDDTTEIHYTLIKDVNDSIKELKELCELLNIYIKYQ